MIIIEITRNLAPLSSREDVVREIIIKNNLTQGLGTAVKALQQEHVNSNESIYRLVNNNLAFLIAIYN